MKNKLILRPLHIGDEKTFLEAFKEWSTSPQEDGFIFFHCYEPGMSFSDYLQILQDESLGRNLKEGRVPCSFLGGFIENKLIGRVSLRHELNDFLLKFGGHIGYGVLFSQRKKGFATEMLRQSLFYCRSLSLPKVLVTCDDDNLGSIKTIEYNNGILEDIYQGPEVKKPKRRYWIKV